MFRGRGRGRGRGGNDGLRQTTLPFARLQAAKCNSKPPTYGGQPTYSNYRGRGQPNVRGGRGGGRGRGRGRGRGAYNNWNPWNKQQQQKQKTNFNAFTDNLPLEDFAPDPEDDEDEDEENIAEGRLITMHNYDLNRKAKFYETFNDNGLFMREWAVFVSKYPLAMKEIREEMNSIEKRRNLTKPGASSRAVVEARFGAIYESLLFPEDGISDEDPRRHLFAGVHIYVNGFTYPTASQLATLMQLTGGSFAWNFIPGRTTHTIATALSMAQKKQERARLTTIGPEWILDCLDAKRLLPIHEYKVIKPKNDIGKMFAAMARRREEALAAMAPKSRAPSPEIINWREFEFEEDAGKRPVVEDVRMWSKAKQQSSKTLRAASPELPGILDLFDDLGTQRPSTSKGIQQPKTPVKKKKKVTFQSSPELQFVLSSLDAMDEEDRVEEQKRKDNQSRNSTENELNLDLSGPDWPQKPPGPSKESVPSSKSTAISKTPTTSTSNLLGNLDPSRQTSNDATKVKNAFANLPPSTNKQPGKPRVVPTFRRAGERRKFAQPGPDGVKPDLKIKPKIPLDVQEYFSNLPQPNQPTAATFTVVRQPNKALPPLGPETRAPVIPPHLPASHQPINYNLAAQRLPPSELAFREFKRKLTRGDESHFVPVDEYMPDTLSAIDEDILGALPEDMQREMKAYVRSKNAKLEEKKQGPTTSKGQTRGRGRGRGRGGSKSARKEVDPDQATLSRWVVRPPPGRKPPTTIVTFIELCGATTLTTTSAKSTTTTTTSTSTSTRPTESVLKRKSSWPEVDLSLRNSSAKLRRSSSKEPVESRRSSEDVIAISSTEENLKRVVPNECSPFPGTSKSPVKKCPKCNLAKRPKKENLGQGTSKAHVNNNIDPSHPKAPKKASKAVENQLKVDQMIRTLRERKISKRHRKSSEKVIALLTGRSDHKLGPNLAGKRRLTAVCAILRQWITAEDEDLLDDDLVYLLKYFSALIDAGRQGDLLLVLHACKEYIIKREASGRVDCWRTAFYETFPAFLRQEPTFRDLISEELFWYAKANDDEEVKKR